MLAALGLLFVLSGAAGLFYEAVWSRYLSLFVGHDAYAQILTLVIYLGGMGLGALLVSRRSHRIRDPLIAYAVVEGIVGVLGLLFHDNIYLPVTGWAYATLFPALGGGTSLLLAKWGLAGLLILPQSILLGATFPLMTAGALRRLPGRPGRTLAILYFTNSLGAAGGVLIAGFYLFQLAGLPGTLIAAAGLNLLVALGALIVSKTHPLGEASADRNDGRSVGDVPADLPIDRPAGLPRAELTRLLMLLAAGTAVASFVYEVGWIRMLSLVLGSSTHSFELMLSAFILGLSLGAWWVRARADRFKDPLRTLAIVQLVMGGLAILSLPLYLESFQWTATLLQATARTEPGYVFFTLSRYAICLIVMLPATFCAGMTLPLMTRMLMAGGSGEAAIGAIYAANTLGSIVGAAATGLVLIPLIGLRGSLVAGGALDMLLGIVAIYALSRAGRPAPRLATAGFVVLAGLGIATLWLMPWRQSLLASGVFRVGRVTDGTQLKMLFHADGRTATIHASQFIATGTKILSTNGKPDGSLTATWAERCDTVAPQQAFSGDDGTQAMLALLLMAHAPRARTGAVIGHGTGMSSHFLLGSPTLESLTTIEIEPAMLAGSRVFYPSNRRVFDDPRSRFAIEDAKSFFAAANAKFDLVLSEPSNPWVSGVSGLFTTEFYGQLRRYLAPGAVFGQWLHTYELSDGLVTSVLAALHENFADYRVFLITGGDLLVVGSPDRPLPPPDWSVTRSSAIAQDLCRFLPMTDAALDRMQVLDRKGLEPLMAAGARANSDFYPSLDLGAERARFLQHSAVGIANLGNGVVGYIGNPVRAEPAFDTTTTSVLAPAPGVRAMLLAAELRQAGQDAAWTDAPGASERYLLRVWNRQMVGDMTPGNWRGWTNDFWTLRRGLHGGAAPSDTAFFARAHAYAARAGAPAGTRAAIAFGEALARRELVSALAAADTLLIEAKAGRVWIPPDDLLDGTVRVFLAGGRPERARAAFDQIRPLSTRAGGDLRLALLNAYVDAAKAGTQ